MAEKKWIDTPGLRDILEKEVPLAGELLASHRYPILVRGMPRTGKSHIRDKILEVSRLVKHEEGVINCAAIPETLVESILFGYKKGAFTGADKDMPGLLFDDSTPPKVVFLEEIGELPQFIQAKLLVFFDTGAFMPVGAKWGQGDKSTLTVIATSNAEDDKFRPDFLARFWEVKVPPLHERREDIPYFLNLFLEGEEKQLHCEELFYLMTYNWPNGVTEIEKACIKIRHYIFAMNIPLSERYFFVRNLLISPPLKNDKYLHYCNVGLWYPEAYKMANLFPYFYLGYNHGRQLPKTYVIHKLITEWKVWCFFFDQNPKSPTNIYEDIQKTKPGKDPSSAKVFHRLRNIEDFLNQSYENGHRLAYFVDFLKEQEMWNKEGLALLNKLRMDAFKKLFWEEEEEEKKEKKDGVEIVQEPPFETMSPAEYHEKFWDYQVKHSRTVAEVEEQYGINRKTARPHINKAKDRAIASED